MSEENVDRFLEGADAFNRGDLDAASDWLDPEVVFEPQAAALEGNVAGPDGVRTESRDGRASQDLDGDGVVDHGRRPTNVVDLRGHGIRAPGEVPLQLPRRR